MISPGERPTRPTLNRDYIIRFALKMIDEDGLDAFSMRRLGARLKVDPMAIYRHIPNKGALLDGVTELLWTQAFKEFPTDAELSWKDRLYDGICALRSVLLRHPHAIILMGTHPLVTTEQFTLIELTLISLEAGGLPISISTIHLLNSLVAYTVGHTLAQVVDPSGGAGGEIDFDAMTRAVAKTPNVARLLQPVLQGDRTENTFMEEQFYVGLQAILDGWKE